jgi:flagellar hook-associated protein 3 FlgL
MRVSDSSFTNNFLNEVNQLQQKQSTLQGEVSSGLDVTLPENNPAIMAQVLSLQTTSAANTQYQNNIAQLQGAAATTATAMNSLQTLSSQASEIALQAGNGTTSTTQLSAYATQVGALLQQALSLGNTQDANGNYIFGGTASSTPPFVATTDANGNITGVTYQGNAQVNQNEIAPNTTVTAQVPGENNTGSGPQGLFADSRTGANLFSDLISLQSNLASGNTSAISSSNAPALTKADDNIITQISANGVMQSALTAANNMATAKSTNIASQISGDTNADLATTMTNLDQTQTAYEAGLESGMRVMQISLVNFLA